MQSTEIIHKSVSDAVFVNHANYEVYEVYEIRMSS